MKNIVQFSGGKDSTAMLLMMLEKGMPVDEIIFCDTGMEFPEVYQHIKQVEKYIGRKITRLSADYSFEYYLYDIPTKPKKEKNRGRGYGWPRMFNRWCTSRMKIRVTEKYLKNLGEYITYIGIAADEPKRHKNVPENVMHLLYEWGITEVEALNYCYDKGFDFGGLYKNHKRIGCWCCPLQRMSDLRFLYHNHKDLWKKLKEMDKNAPYPFKEKYSLEDLEQRFDLEEAQGYLF